MMRSSKRIVLFGVLAVIGVVLVLAFAGCNKNQGENVSETGDMNFVLNGTEAVTDINGDNVTDSQGNSVTAAVYEYSEVVTDDKGEAVTDSNGVPVTTKKYIHEHTEAVTDEDGNTLYDNNNNIVTTKIAVDEEGSTVKPATDRTTAPSKTNPSTTKKKDPDVGQDIGDQVSNSNTAPSAKPVTTNKNNETGKQESNTTKPSGGSTSQTNTPSSVPSTATPVSSTKVTTTKVTTTKKPAPTEMVFFDIEDEQQEIVDNLNPDEKEESDKVVSSMMQGDASIFSYMYDGAGNFFYTENDPWQRNFGFNRLYDWAAALVVMYYDTVRVKFNHGGDDWMIQMWKGQYGYIFIGSEIGVYYREPGKDSDQYDCADDTRLMPMEMTLYKKDETGSGTTKLFTRKYAPQWWSTGFVVGHLNNMNFSDRSCLIVSARLTLNDSEMAAKFANGLKAAGFKTMTSQPSYNNADSYYIEGKDVYFTWRNIDQKV